MKKIKYIAYYLPQFHRLKFNDDYWGKGFTEWTNTAKAKPLFKRHYQPHVPADLGFYDLNVDSVRIEQAELAKEYGIDGFCYWHYWFANNRPMMDMPFNKVVESGEPDFPFCLAWANHDWHDLRTKEVTIKQEYGGEEDYRNHFKTLQQAFLDPRYIRVDDKPLFVVYAPFEIPNTKEFFSIWNEMAAVVGIKGFHFVGIVKSDEEAKRALDIGFDGVNIIRLSEFENRQNSLYKHVSSLLRCVFGLPYKFSFKKAMKYFVGELEEMKNVYPTAISGWDHTPRSGKKALVLTGYTPPVFGKHLKDVVDRVTKTSNDGDEIIIFIRAWNEWAEGNHLEPDLKYGLGFLEEVKKSKEALNED